MSSARDRDKAARGHSRPAEDASRAGKSREEEPRRASDGHRHKDREREKEGKADKERKHRRREEGARPERERGGRRSEERGERGEREHRPRDKERRERDEQPRSHKRPREPTAEEAAVPRKAEAGPSLASLEDEAEARRRKVRAWQEQKARAVAEQEALRAAALAEKGEREMKWTLEDESDEETPEAAAQREARPGPAPRLAPEEEVDPLDAFMSQNAAQAAQEQAAAAEEAGEEIDPLDAFMAAQVIPSAQQDLAASSAPAPKKEEDADGDTAMGFEAPAAPLPGPTGRLALPTRMDVDGAPGAPGSSGPLASAATTVKIKLENGAAAAAGRGRPARRIQRTRPPESDSSSGEPDEDSEEEQDDAAWKRDLLAGKLSKSDKLGTVDHAAMDYPKFRRSFYIETSELARMGPQEVAALRRSLDDIKVRGKNAPKPVKGWAQCGLSSRVLEVLRKLGYERPMPIQAQALPVVMSGRDCIGIAKTGSGKTLAFVLPMLRHIKDQAPLAQGDGPIALVMAPTRELVTQIGRDIKKLARAVTLTVVCAYGGQDLGTQISDLKRGAEIVVCTPGRMIDLLVTSNGKITNLRRVTYLVLDEADRMFDMGFEPQIMRMVANTRPDRQTVMFSATFPASVEVLARRALNDPVEIQVGGRSVVNSDIEQIIELRPPEERFLRVLEVLGQWYERGKVLIFVANQEDCDQLFRDLLKVGYPCLSLHGGKDQADRESTIGDFKSDVCSLLVATGVAARGLDVKDLVLVVNYDTPNHHEEYVHRVGRTGRAGNKGTAITFIAPEDERFAPDLVKALKESGAPVPQDLLALATSFQAKRKAGTAQAHGSGYGGSGFKFDVNEEDERKSQRQLTAKEAAKEAGTWEGEEEEDDSKDGQIKAVDTNAAAVAAGVAANAAMAAANAAQLANFTPEQQGQIRAAQELAAKLSGAGANYRPPPPNFSHAYMPSAQALTARQPLLAPEPAPAPSQALPPPPEGINPLVAAAQAVANKFAAAAGLPQSTAAGPRPLLPWTGNLPTQPAGPHFELEFEINDFPMHARWKITHKETMWEITQLTGAAVTTKGVHVAPGKQPPEGERPLYLHIEGPTEGNVQNARVEIKRILAEFTEKAMRRDAAMAQGGGRYNV